MTAAAPALTPDLVAGLRRLKLARIRAVAAEVCQTAKTQRWAPDEFLRTLIEAEIAARDESNLRGRVKQAGFPVVKTLDDFKVQASSVPQATFNYLAGLEWILPTTWNHDLPLQGNGNYRICFRLNLSIRHIGW